MKAFKVEVEGIDWVIFAHNYDHAAAVFAVNYYNTRESVPPDFVISEYKPFDPTEAKHLKDACDRYIPGVGEYDPDVGWEIVDYPFDRDPS